jgi:hypothetical protein
MPIQVEVPGQGIVEFPDGMTDDQIAAVIRKNAPRPQAQQEVYDPTEGMSGTDKFLAGMGKAFTDLGRGAGQMVGLVDQKDVDEAKRIDAPLMKTGAGLAGNIAGNIVPAAVASVVPGANTAIGSAAVGGVLGALQPVGAEDSRLANTALGGVSGYAGAKLGQMVGSSTKAARQAEALRQSQNATRDATIAQARGAGYVIPPSSANPSWINRTLESLAGKEATRQTASVQNQEVTNALARKALGLADGTALSDDVLKQFRATASQPYKDVAAMDEAAADALEKLKDARFQTNAYMKHYNRTADPASLAKSREFGDLAENLEASLEDFAKMHDMPDLIDGLRAARKQIAKSYTVERALNDATGNVDAKQIARQLSNGAPLTAELETIGKFASAFPQASRLSDDIGSPGVSKLKFALGSILGAGGAAGGGPVGAAAGALPFVAPDAAKALLLSRPYQAMATNPSYGVGPTRALAEALMRPRVTAPLATGLAVTDY